MKQLNKITNILLHDIWFHIFATTSIGLMVTSFFLPPTGVIDSSVFMGVGELFGFATLWEVHIAIKKGMGAKLSKDDITLEINNDLKQ